MVRRLQSGVNDLATLFPSVANEACGWDPFAVLSAVKDKKEWQCSNGHRWMATVNHRTSSGTQCPYCSGRKAMEGVNDLKTMFPSLAQQAYNWNPSNYLPQSNQKKQWICENKHIWQAAIYMRTFRHTGCPLCNTGGFNPSQDAWMYLVETPDKLKIGITNKPKSRLRTHRQHGWQLMEIAGPMPGSYVAHIETIIKRWIKASGLRLDGTHENWTKDACDVSSLREIAMLAGLDARDCHWLR
jgi:hypothetical protein